MNNQTYFYPAASFADTPGMKYTIDGQLVQNTGEAVNSNLIPQRPTIPRESQVVEIQQSSLPKGASPDVDSQPALVPNSVAGSTETTATSTQTTTSSQSANSNISSMYLAIKDSRAHEQKAFGTSSPAAAISGPGVTTSTVTGVSGPVTIVDTITNKFSTSSVPTTNSFPNSSNIL